MILNIFFLKSQRFQDKWIKDCHVTKIYLPFQDKWINNVNPTNESFDNPEHAIFEYKHNH